MVLPGRGQCGHDFPIALSCKGAGCAHRAAAGAWWRAVHLTDHVAPSLPASANGVVFHAAAGVDAIAITRVQESVRKRLLRALVRRGLLPGDAAQAMAPSEHGGGFSVEASMRIVAADRAGRERLLRYCAP